MKQQTYTIRFNRTFDTALDAIRTVGSAIHQDLRDYIEEGLIAGEITDESLTINEGGNEVSVVRNWEDASHAEFIALSTYSGMTAAIEAATTVDSLVSYTFADA
jgi:hypothetical protein|tara:strand:- start:882 stop:1193 length:312 start_codon:yes stop_codon:yes gene_type:complete